MRYDYYCCELYNADLISFLNENGIKYKIKHEGETFPDGRPLPVYIIFTIRGDSAIIEKLVHNYRCSPVISIFYSQSELNHSKLLTMQPKAEVVEIENTDDAYKFSCTWLTSRGVERAYHKEQVGTFEIRNEPRHCGRTAMWASLGFSEVFVDQRIYGLAQDNAFSGLGFDRVMLRNHKYSKEIFQFKPQTILPNDCIAFNRMISDKSCVELTCPYCGKKRYGCRDPFQLQMLSKHFEDTSDVYITERVFGHGIAYPLYLVSQRFYQALKKNGLAYNVIFEPVIFID